MWVCTALDTRCLFDLNYYKEQLNTFIVVMGTRNISVLFETGVDVTQCQEGIALSV